MSFFRPWAMLFALFAAAPTFAAEEYTATQQAQDNTIVETVLRLDGFDLNSSEKGKSAVLRYCRHNVGTPTFFELVKKFHPTELADVLLELALEKSDATEGVTAADALLQMNQAEHFKKVIAGEDAEAAARAINVLALTGHVEAINILNNVVTNGDRAIALRNAAARGIGSSEAGQQKLLDLVENGQLPQGMNFTVANILFASSSEDIRKAAALHLKLPESVGSKPLPPIAEMVKQDGDATAGQKIFRTVGTCAKCHKVHGEGKEVGPDLSEIGTKLTREALYVAILDPSAGVSHNYEQYTAYLDNGQQFTGLKISETDDSLTLRNAEAIDREIPKDQLDELIKSKQSLMPSGLQKLINEQQLVDLVSYLSTLKKKE